MAYSNAQRQAIQQNDPNAYLAAGGTLTNGKIPRDAINAVNNPNYYATAANAYDFGYPRDPNPSAQDAALQKIADINPETADRVMDILGYTKTPISSSSLSQQGTPKLPSLPSDTTNYQAAIARGQGMIAGGSDNGNQGLYDTANLVASLIPQPEGVERAFYDTYGKSAEQVRNEESDAQRELKARKSALRAAQAELQGTQAEIQAVVDTAKASVLQLQEDSKGRGITRAGILPQEAGIQRTAAIAVLPLQSKALAQQARIASLQGDVTTAQETLALAQGVLDKAFEYKVHDIDLQNDYKQKVFSAIVPFLTKAEERRYEEAKTATTTRNTEIKDLTTEARGWMKETFETDPTLAGEFGDLIPLIPKPESKTYATEVAQFREKLNGLVAKIKAKTSYVQVDENGQTVQYQKDASGKLIASTREVLGGTKSTENKAGTLGTAPSATLQPYYNAFDSAVLGLPQFSQAAARQTFLNYINANDLEGARNYIVRAATQGLPAADQTQALGRMQATTALKDIQNLLAQAKAKGSPTNLLTGSLVNIAQKLGTTTDPDLSYIGARIQQQLQVYRRSMTGVAFSPNEAKEYKKIFPDITNIESLNSAKIKALSDAFEMNNRSAIAFLIGDKNYDAIFGAIPSSTLPSQTEASSATIGVVSNEDAYNIYLKTIGQKTTPKSQPTKTRNSGGNISSLFEGYQAPSFGMFDSIFK